MNNWCGYGSLERQVTINNLVCLIIREISYFCYDDYHAYYVLSECDVRVYVLRKRFDHHYA
jgi:hypothetical protein